MKKKNYILIGVIMIIIVAGYFVYQNFPQNKSQTITGQELKTACQTSADCKEFISHNTCEVYCANTEQTNNKVISELKVTCDPTLWDRPFLGNCSCIDNNCQFVQ